MNHRRIYEEIEKRAKITTPLQEHQERARDKSVKNNLLVYHGLGSGKTLTSLAIAEANKKPTYFVVPASLQSNIEKEIKNHTKDFDVPHYEVMSYNKFVKDYEKIKDGSLVIFDEAHKLRNQGTKVNQAFNKVINPKNRIVMLSATPVYNRPEDLLFTVKGLYPDKTPISMDVQKFKEKFISSKKVQPGFIGKMLGIKPGVRIELKNKKILKEILKDKVDFKKNIDNEFFPEKEEKIIEADLTDEQKNYYDFVSGKMPFWLKFKMRAGLPPTKTEAKELNSFLTGVRQASLSIKPYNEEISYEEAADKSGKISRAIDELKKKQQKDKNFKGIVYSNYVEAGLKPYAAALTKEKIPHSIFTGDLTKKQKDEIVKKYNSGETGVLLLSSSGGEGLDLKNTKLIQILEPHFNESKINQVIGRGIRYKSHETLPKDERKVEVQKFVSTMPTSFWSKIFGKDKTVDEYLNMLSGEKNKLFSEYDKVFEMAN